MSTWKLILDIVSLVMGICVSGLSLYTAYLKFISKKIKFLTYSPNFSTFYGDKISVVIENQSMSNFSITDIFLIYDNHYIIQLEKFDEPLVLEPFNAKKVTSKPITITSPIKFSELDKYRNIFMLLKTSKGDIYSKFRGKITKQNKDHSVFQLIVKHSDSINGIVVSNDIKYVLYFKGTDDQLKMILINWAGFMSDSIKGFNAIPRNIVSDKEQVKQFFEDELTPLGIPFTLEERTIK